MGKVLRLISLGESTALYIRIPPEIVEQLGWKYADDVEIDIPSAYPDQIIVYKVKQDE